MRKIKRKKEQIKQVVEWRRLKIAFLLKPSRIYYSWQRFPGLFSRQNMIPLKLSVLEKRKKTKQLLLLRR